ncbi:Uncharacterised protein [Mycobacteroides abscessus subsp. abscessus]|nr:Uncharacterised protein [Mycobacteroides abscessus subsp. abscessus]
MNTFGPRTISSPTVSVATSRSSSSTMRASTCIATRPIDPARVLMFSASRTVTRGAVSVMPKPSVKGTPRSRMKSMTVRGTGDPPPMAKRSADRLKESKSDTCVRAVHMAGTMN